MIKCNFDRFASNVNTKTELFNNASFFVGTSGVDCFSYDWGLGSINWLFPAPCLVVKAVNHFKNSEGIGLLIAPLSKSSHFYAYLKKPELQKYIVKFVSFSGKNIFYEGSDKSSYFGPNFDAAVGVWHFNFKD